LDDPLRWIEGKSVFVPSMGDLFHMVPFGFVDRVFATMALCPQHTFQVLTKRSLRMLEYIISSRDGSNVWTAADKLRPHHDWSEFRWPLPNAWLGASAEDQEAVEERLSLLVRTPAALRFVSLEPLLEGIYIGEYLTRQPVLPDIDPGFDGIDWVIVGGESGSSARPMSLDWVRDIRDQCRAAGVPLFVKQMGSAYSHDRAYPYRATKDLHGADMSSWPTDLRIREMPGEDR